MKYVGSVRFFKHIIWLTVLAIVIAAFGVGISGYAKSDKLAAEVSSLQEQLGALPEKAEPDPLPASDSAALSYQQLYPELYSSANDTVKSIPAGQTAYLTFDDGPSTLTADLLDQLDAYDVKATFFVTAQNPAELDMIAEAARRGHTVGIHSYSHKYRAVYESVEAFLEDFDKMYQVILEQTGRPPEIFRFPGGSINAYNTDIYQQIIAEMTRRGFVYYDWNVYAADTADGASAETIADAICDGAAKNRFAVIDCHDGSGHQNTVEAIGIAIEDLRAEGFTFAPLTPAVTPVHFSYVQEGQ